MSVVIPVYNGRDYLRRALLSVLGQTSPPSEILVIDDGSVDGTEASVEDLLGHVTWIRHDRNVGVSACRNTGIEAASGDLVAFLDSDDWWLPPRLETQIALHLAQPSLEMTFCDFSHVLPSGSPVGWQGGLRRQMEQRGVGLTAGREDGFRLDTGALWALIRFTSFIHPSTVICQKHLFDRVGGFDAALHGAEDLEFWIRVTASSAVGYCDQNMVRVEQRPGSLGRQTVKMASGMVRVYESVLSRFPEMPAVVRRDARTHCARQHVTLASLAFHAGKRRVARAHALRSLRYRWTADAARLILRSALP